MSEIFGCQHLKTKFIGWTTLPQKLDINVRSNAFCLKHKFGQPRLDKAQQHIGRFNFAALAMCTFHLKRGGVVCEERADLESAVFFIKNIHKNAAERSKKSAAIIPQRCKAPRYWEANSIWNNQVG